MTILVIGGTGKTGRRVAQRLQDRGVPHRIGSRNGDPAFDWDDEQTWRPALEGVTAAYVTYYPDLAFPGVPELMSSFTAAAKEAGVARLVLLSGRGEDGALACEQVIEQSGIPWTVVRCNWFMQNFNESFFLDPVRSGHIDIPAGDAVEPFVDADDIADVVVAALTEEGHDGQVYVLSGPRLLSFQEVAEKLSEVTGRPIEYSPVGHDEYAASLAKEGLPEDFADLFAIILDGRNASITDGVQRALGRQPTDFADYARRAAKSGVWDLEPVPASAGR